MAVEAIEKATLCFAFKKNKLKVPCSFEQGT